MTDDGNRNNILNEKDLNQSFISGKKNKCKFKPMRNVSEIDIMEITKTAKINYEIEN